MVLESTMLCVDDSDYMRNGDFIPTRLLAEEEAVNLICLSKIRSNPENDLGLLALARMEVLVTLTSNVGKILYKLHQLSPNGTIVSLVRGFRIAQLALKHRPEKRCRMRIVALIGSPIYEEYAELVILAKKLKKEKVYVDIVCIGEEDANSGVFNAFMAILNEKTDVKNNLLMVPSGADLSVAVVGSSITGSMRGTADYPMDPYSDPELEYALQMSLEDYHRQQALTTETPPTKPEGESTEHGDLKEDVNISETNKTSDLNFPSSTIFSSSNSQEDDDLQNTRTTDGSTDSNRLQSLLSSLLSYFQNQTRENDENKNDKDENNSKNK